MPALPILDSCDLYTTGQISRFWSNPAGTIVTGRNGNGIQIANGAELSNDIPGLTSISRGNAYKASQLTGRIIFFEDVANAVTVALLHGSSGAVFVRVSSGGDQDSSPSPSGMVAVNGVFYPELAVSAAIVGGNLVVSFTARVGGIEAVSGSITVTGGPAAQFTRYGHTAPDAGTCVIDDSYTDGGPLYGDSDVVALHANANGDRVEWTPLTAPNFSQTNEQTADDDATHVDASSPGLADLYKRAGLAASSIGAVQAVITAKATSAGSPATVRPRFKSGSVELPGSILAKFGTAYSVAREGFANSPFTGLPWGVSELNGTQAGAEFLSSVYAFKRAITIDHTKVPTADQTDFPVGIVGTYAWFKSVANGGKLEDNLHGFDMAFAADSVGTVPLKFERVVHDLVTGQVEFWVKLPTVSHSVDTVFYVFYGAASVTTDQSDKANVWTNGFSVVHHFNALSGALIELRDSTELSSVVSPDRGFNSTQVSSPAPTGVAGKIGAAGLFDGANDFSRGGVILDPIDYLPLGSNERSMSLWAKNLDLANLRIAYGYGGNIIGSGGDWRLKWNPTGNKWNLGDGNFVEFPGVADNDWHQIVCTLPSGGMNYSDTVNYVDGAGVTNSSSSAGIGTNDYNYAVGVWGGSGGKWIGLLDELRIASAARTASWWATEFNNQSSPDTFYSFGSEQPGPATPARMTQFALEVLLPKAGGGPRAIYRGF